MRLLTVCDQGNNRSITLAHQLKYLGHDVLSAGLQTNKDETLRMLYDWAERIITTDTTQVIPDKFQSKVVLFDLGIDVYPRPFNTTLLQKVKWLIKNQPL